MVEPTVGATGRKRRQLEKLIEQCITQAEKCERDAEALKADAARHRKDARDLAVMLDGGPKLEEGEDAKP